MGAANAQVVQRLIDGLNRKDVSVMDDVFHDDAVMEWPQSGERIVGAENRRAIYGAMPVIPVISPRRMLPLGDVVVAEAVLDYEGDAYDVVFIFEFRGDRIARETAYWATPFDPPEWRAEWVERIT